MVPFLLVVLIGLQLAQMTRLFLTEPPMKATVPAVPAPQVQPERLLSFDTVLQSLKRFNPWERPLPKKVAPPPPPPPVEKAVETELALELIGTMVLPNDASWAILLSNGNRQKQISLRLGEEVDGAILERIERNAVFLRNNGRLEKLSMAGAESMAKRRAISDGSGKREKKPHHKKAAKRRRKKGRTLSRQAYTRLLSKGMGILAGVNITPYYRGADSVGYRLKFSKDNADMRQLGLLNGDVVKKVNGISVLDQKKFSRYAPQLKKQSSVRFEILRNNRPKTIQLRIEK